MTVDELIQRLTLLKQAGEINGKDRLRVRNSIAVGEGDWSELDGVFVVPDDGLYLHVEEVL